MSGKSLNFGDKEIKKSNFYENKKLFKIYHIDVNKILVSKKEPHDANKQISQLNISLNIVTMIPLDLYA